MHPITLELSHSQPLSKPILTDEDLKLQFSRLTTLPLGCSSKKAEAYSYRNRYPDVLPFDHNRVQLRDPEFYFNASYVLGEKAIASQGPKPNEIHEFWRMIWEKDCSLIVMLTNLEEKGKEKCALYWTEDADTESFFFEVIDEEILYEGPAAKIVKRIIEVEQNDQIKTFTQLHLVDWPDHGTVSPEILEQLVRLAHQERNGDGPLFAHCSAGISRTGTFLATYEAFCRGSKGVFEIVESLRHERMWMIQNPEQYILAQRAAERLT